MMMAQVLFSMFFPKRTCTLIPLSYQFKLKFGTYTDSNMENSMMLFTFFAFDWKKPFWANLVQNAKIVNLKTKFGS